MDRLRRNGNILMSVKGRPTGSISIQSRKQLQLERQHEKEKLTRKEASMAKARAELEATYAKYGIKPYVEKRVDLPKRPPLIRKKTMADSTW
jgi:hypothetical protein